MEDKTNTIWYNQDGWVCGLFPSELPIDDKCKELQISDDEIDMIRYSDVGMSWRVVDGKLIKDRYEEVPASIQIDELKSKLRSTDYQAIKYSEGQLSEEEYAPMKAQRQAWRDEINRLEELE